MARIQSLWRPALFSAVGAGFLDDATLKDGVHLRWRSDYRLGLPYERNQAIHGGFRVYISHVGSIVDADLFERETPYSAITRSNLSGGADAGMETTGDTLRFWKRVQPQYQSLFWRWDHNWGHLARSLVDLGEEDRALARYVQAVMTELLPGRTSTSAVRVYGEACAVDVHISTSTTQPVQFVGLDRKGREVAQVEAQASQPVARLRAPGMAAVRIEPAAGQPLPVLSEVRWVLCEDYCQADSIWSDELAGEARFHADPDFHTPNMVLDRHFSPFLAPVDADMAADAIMNLFVGSADVQTMLDQVTPWGMAAYRLQQAEKTPPAGGPVTTAGLPVLQSLIAAAADPVMARILGLYEFLDKGTVDGVEGHDLRIEADFPFFAYEHLREVDDRLAEMLHKDPKLPFFWETDKSTDQSVLCGTTLDGLVLFPEIDVKPSTPAPENFSYTVHVSDVPSQTDPAQADLFANVEIRVPKTNVVDTLPFLTPIAYELERSLTNAPFVNVIEAEEEDPDVLDEIGIVPPVYFLQHKAGTTTQISFLDNFVVPAAPNQHVRYRLTAYDIFGRPSVPVESPLKRPLNVPCHPPASPANLSAQVYEGEEHLYLEVYFSLPSKHPPLQASGQQLEILVHRLPTDSSDSLPPDQIQWTGSIPARRLMIPYASDQSLNLSKIQRTCMTLDWKGGRLNYRGALESVCTTEFPVATPVIEPVDPPSMPYADTGYRTYRLQMAVADPKALKPDAYRWCARLRVRGRCSGQSFYYLSDQPCVTGEWLITPAPQPPLQPPLETIPVSTYPDRFGDSYFSIDLAQFVSPGALVNVYLARLDRLVPALEAVVSGTTLLDEAALLQAARATKQRFELLTQSPVEYTAENRFYAVQVPGNLRQYHVAAVVGTNQYLQEHAWGQAGVVLFTTPAPIPLPVLTLASVEPLARIYPTSYYPGVKLAYTVPAEDVPDPAHPPKVQLLRRDLSSGNPNAGYAGQATGVLLEPTGGDPVYHFAFTNRVTDWHRYEYMAYLLLYVPGRDEYVRSGEPVRCEVIAPSAGYSSPLFENRTIHNYAGEGWRDLQITFAAGDFDFSFSKVLANNSIHRMHGSIRSGRILGLPSDICTLEIVPVFERYEYQLHVRDYNPEDRPYTFRLSADGKTWSKKE